jgi:hypothetical protein
MPMPISAVGCKVGQGMGERSAGAVGSRDVCSWIRVTDISLSFFSIAGIRLDFFSLLLFLLSRWSLGRNVTVS